jgi:hypothetical protein
LVNNDQLRATPRAAAWVSPAVAGLLVLSIFAGCSRQTFVVPHERARDLVALFGDAWSAPIGEFRITGGRMEGGIVRVFLAAPGRSVSMTLEHARVREAEPPGSVVVEQPGNDVIIVLRCTPACDAPSMALLRSLAERVLAGHPGRLWVPAYGFAVGRERLVAFVVALGLYCVAALLGLAALWRARPFSRERLADVTLVCALSFAATALLGEPSVANWYSNHLSVVGGILDAEDQNGIAGFFLQAAVRSILPWTERTLFGLNLFLHAAAGGVFYVAFRALLIERGVALLALLLWAVLPLSVRIGWSDAQHVQVELLFALLLLAWLRAQDEHNWPERLLAPLLAALLPFVRPETLVLAPLPLLFAPFVGDRRRSRRVLDAVVYGGLLAMSAAAVFELFVRRYDMPIPDLATRMRSLFSLPEYLQLFRQFVFVNSGMPNWFPGPATALLVIGVVVLAVRQPARLAAILAAFCIPQLLLDRLFNAEGMVGARYFLPLLALLALVAAYGLATVAEGFRRLLARYAKPVSATRAARVAAVLGALTVVPASLPLYQYEYAFQGEHRFLRQALAALPAGARVLHLPVREDDRIHNDLDCCLDLPKSPLVLTVPLLHFEPIPIRPDRPRLPAAVDDRTYYYEGAPCRLAATPASEGRNPGLSRMLSELCAVLARDPRLELVASALVPSNGFWPFLEPGDVPLRLYRIRPSDISLSGAAGSSRP